MQRSVVFALCAGVWWCVEMKGFPCLQSVRRPPFCRRASTTSEDIPSHFNHTTQNNTTKHKQKQGHHNPRNTTPHSPSPSLTTQPVSPLHTKTTTTDGHPRIALNNERRRKTHLTRADGTHPSSLSLTHGLQQRLNITTSHGWMA